MQAPAKIETNNWMRQTWENNSSAASTEVWGTAASSTFGVVCPFDSLVQPFTKILLPKNNYKLEIISWILCHKYEILQIVHFKTRQWWQR